MKLILTKEVWHRTNPNYICMLVQFEDSDVHYFHQKKNWMPKESEICDIIKTMVGLKHSLCQMFNQAICDGLKKRIDG